jgi:hypothetical protein
MNTFTNKFVNRMFRRIDGVVWDLTTGVVGLKTVQGIYSLTLDEQGKPGVSVNPFDEFGFAIPAFATQSTFEQVKPGEIIVGDTGIIGWVVEKTEAAYKVIDHNGYNKVYTPPKVAILNQSGTLVVRNLMDLLGGKDGASGFTNSLLPLLMLNKGEESGLEKILPILLMTQQQAATTAGTGAAVANPMASMLPLLLLKDGKFGNGGTMETMLMASMFSGGAVGGGMNPLMMAALVGDGNLFGLNSETKNAPLSSTKVNSISAVGNGSAIPQLRMGA